MKRSILCFIFGFFLFTSTAFAGSITLRVMAINPSEEQSQSVPIKVYLPVEVKPEDIVYKEDLEVAYDTQQGSYYVFGEYELKPQEVLEKEIEVKDVWVIDEAQLAVVQKEAKDILDSFKKTEYEAKSEALRKDIEKKLTEIIDLQRISAINPSQHISDYRYCLGLLNSVKTDLVSAKTLLAEVKPKGMARFTWKLITFIIIFLGVLGLGFYLIWLRQAKLETEQKSS